MYDWERYRKYILIGLGVFIVIAFIFVQQKGNQLDRLEKEKSSIDVPSKKEVNQVMTQADVEKYQGWVEKKMKQFENRELPEGEFDTKNTGVNLIRALHTDAGAEIMSKSTSPKKYKEHYKDYSFDIKDTFAKENKDNVNVYVKIEMKKNGKKFNELYNLARFTFDKDGKLIGGSEYEQQR
ncbi:hypothetical protein ACR56S_04030 [Staphylococcus hominis]|mgnify:FL=1|uniref:hypothetical protein n=1 Tax=Staphylococcus hominis TaxID=1290 RepID=UPI003DA1A2BD